MSRQLSTSMERQIRTAVAAIPKAVKEAVAELSDHGEFESRRRAPRDPYTDPDQDYDQEDPIRRDLGRITRHLERQDRESTSRQAVDDAARDVNTTLANHATRMGIPNLWSGGPVGQHVRSAVAHLGTEVEDWDEALRIGYEVIGDAVNAAHDLALRAARADTRTRVNEVTDHARQMADQANRDNGADNLGESAPASGPEGLLIRLERDTRRAAATGGQNPDLEELIRRAKRGGVTREELAS
jgi:hypothetical protein